MTEQLSPQLRGGGGFRFEHGVAAVYLAALLTETTAPGLDGRQVARVALQQAVAGNRMDDVIVDAVAADESTCRLSLQVKQSLRISAAPSNSDFRQAITTAAETIAQDGFRSGVDRVGVATGGVADGPFQALKENCLDARLSATYEEFRSKVDVQGYASRARRDALDHVGTILGEAGAAIPGRAAYDLLREFVPIRFDILHRGAVIDANTMAILAGALRPDAAADAPGLWDRLLTTASTGGVTSAGLTRSMLVSELAGAFRLRGPPSLQRTLDLIAEEARLAATSIRADIGGWTVPRLALMTKVEEARRTFTRLVGLPGVGKSALVRQLVVQALERGPVLFLKPDRLAGGSWQAYAGVRGYDPAPLVDLLSELAAAGSGIVVVDAIDRVPVADQGVVRDVLSTVAALPRHLGLRVMMTVRTDEVDAIASWLPPEVLDGPEAGVVAVEPFDDDEAATVVARHPALASLLSSDTAIQEIARRPFFARVLLTLGAGPQRASMSEADLAEAWWLGGGYAAAGANAMRRRTTLQDLAQRGATTMGRNVRADGLDPDTLVSLVEDRVIELVHAGRAVNFAHDIFFEWAYLQLLLSRLPDWTQVIADAGEPPVLGRPVELLSQWTFERGEQWSANEALVARPGLRPQWRRAWLCGPFGSPRFAENDVEMERLVFRDGAALLPRLVVWFQAGKTRPNPLMLDGTFGTADLTERSRTRIAHDLAGPAHVPTWQRFVRFLLRTAERHPTAAMPAVVEAFAVWHNLFRLVDVDAAETRVIVARADEWLSAIEERVDADRPTPGPDPWEGLPEGAFGPLQTRLRTILLTAGPREHHRIAAYLDRFSHRKRPGEDAMQQILVLSPLLARHHANDLVAVTLAAVLDPLPEERAARAGREPHGFLHHGSHEWRSLSIDRQRGFFPAAPSREPFRSLFEHSPDAGRHLVARMANHATQAWRQLHVVDRGQHGTPIPLTVDWPWGPQAFHGDWRSFAWPRGIWGPDVLGCGLMALEAWSLSQLETGREPDKVVRDVVEGHESNAVLSTALLICFSHGGPSAAGAALVVQQRIWRWDWRRFGGELGGPSNLGGFITTEDREHEEAVRRLNDGTARRLDMRNLAVTHVLGSVESDHVREAIGRFPANLPFDLEEEKADEGTVAGLRAQALRWSDFADPANYRTVVDAEQREVGLAVASPRPPDPDAEAEVAETEEWFSLLGVAAAARRAMRSGGAVSRQEMQPLLDAVRRLDRADLFAGGVEDRTGEAAGVAVSAVAAAVLAVFLEADQSEFAWACNVVRRAADLPELRGPYWTSASVPVNHAADLARTGLTALIRAGRHETADAHALLRLCAHPLEAVGGAAVISAFSLHLTHPRIAWAALRVAVARAVVPVERPRRFDGEAAYDQEDERLRALAADAVAWLEEPDGGFTVRTLPPSPMPLPDDDEIDDDLREGWQEPATATEALDQTVLVTILKDLPIATLMVDLILRQPLIEMLSAMIGWLVSTVHPPQITTGQWSRSRDRRSMEYMSFSSALLAVAGRVSVFLTHEEAVRYFLAPVLDLPDEPGEMLVAPYVSALTCAGVLDPPTIAPSAIPLLERCAGWVTRHQQLTTRWNRDGGFYGLHFGRLLRHLLFVEIDHAGGASRFVNGNFNDLPAILPIIRAIGPMAAATKGGLDAYLALCERAVEHFPVGDFVDTVLGLLDPAGMPPASWRGTSVPARIAGLIHDMAMRGSPLEVGLSRRMLRILDALVDLGDRRSAALQSSQVFRDVRSA